MVQGDTCSVCAGTNQLVDIPDCIAGGVLFVTGIKNDFGSVTQNEPAKMSSSSYITFG